MGKFYHEKVIDEIIGLIKDNLILKYNHDEDALPNLRKYCKEKSHTRYKLLPNELLIFFAKEAFDALINCEFLYDFRSLE